MSYYKNDRLAPKRQNGSGVSFDAPFGEPATKVPRPRKRVRNRLQMKPDGSIVCETSEVVEEVDDASRFNSSLVGGERLIKLELLQEDNQVDPLLPVDNHVDNLPSSTFLHLSNVVSVPKLKVEQVEVKREDEIKTEDGAEDPKCSTFSVPETELDYYNGCGQESVSAIPVIDISEPDVPDTSARCSPAGSQLHSSHPILSKHLVSDKPFSDDSLCKRNAPPAEDLDTTCSTISAHSPMMHDEVSNPSDDDEPQSLKHIQQTQKLVSNKIDVNRSSAPLVVDDRPKNTDGCPCIIETLLRVSFVNKQWATEERKAIVIKGKPTQFPIRFRGMAAHRDKLHWLTGCTARDELYCWPCLLFQSQLLWYSTNSILSVDALIHERTSTHKKSVLMLNKLEDHFQKIRNKKKKNCLTVQPSHMPVSEKPSYFEDVTRDEDIKTNNNNYSCLIRKLIHNNFSCLSQEERTKILLKGRPRPLLEELSLVNQNLPSDQEYNKIDWLAGSSELKRLFCWPCLLSTQKTGAWAKFGFGEFRRLTDAAARHETTQAHMDAYLQLKVWESEIEKEPKVVSALVEQKAIEVRKSRDFLKYVLDVACFLKKQINNSSIDIDDYVDVLKLITCRDEKLKYFFKEKSLDSDEAIKTLISPYLERILMSLHSVVMSRVKEELEKTPFMSLFLDDTSIHDKMRSTYVAVIVRYTTETGDLRERFVKFIKAATDRPIRNFLEDVKTVINELDCAKKIVGFTYDGAVVQSLIMKFFNNALKNAFPSANFFHYKEHLLRRLIIQSLTHIKCCRNFIVGLAEISSFFENTPKAKFSFLSIGGLIDNDFSLGLIPTVMNNYCLMMKFFDNIKSDEHSFEWNNKIVAQADKFVKFLLRLPNRFLIVLLSKIFSEVDHLSRVIQEKFDILAWHDAGQSAVEKIKANSFEDVFRTACNLPSSESRLIVPRNTDTFREIYLQVVTDVSLLLLNRTSDMKKWEVFDSIPDIEGCSKFLENARCRLASASLPIAVCPTLDCQKLLPQLVLVCGNARFFGNKDIDGLIRCLRDYDMVDTVSELYKLLMFTRTVPMIANDLSTVPAIRKMADYIKGRKDLDETDTLLWMEKDLLTALQSELDFQGEVIDYVILEDIKKNV